MQISSGLLWGGHNGGSGWKPVKKEPCCGGKRKKETQRAKGLKEHGGCQAISNLENLGQFIFSQEGKGRGETLLAGYA